MKKTPKGEGSHTSRQLTAEQKTKLTLWIFQNKEIVEKNTSVEIAAMTTESLGFSVSPSSARTLKLAVFPDMKKERRGGRTSISKLSEILEMISGLDKRISRIEKEFGINL